MTLKKKPRVYEGRDITVEYDAARCIHVAECVKGLPSVFDPDRRPWVDPDAATAEEIAAVVRRCPTGALHYRGGKTPAETPPSSNCVRMVADGPLIAEGRLVIRLPTGDAIEETRAALCRCGASTNKPFCDNGHVSAGFRDPGEDVTGQLADSKELGAEAPLTVEPEPDGPLVISGPVTVEGCDGSRASGGAGALCRCGASAKKPYCDGSHFAAGFRSE